MGADGGYHNLTAVHSCLGRILSLLTRMEGDGQAGFNRAVSHLARIGIDPAGQVE